MARFFAFLWIVGIWLAGSALIVWGGANALGDSDLVLALVCAVVGFFWIVLPGFMAAVLWWPLSVVLAIVAHLMGFDFTVGIALSGCLSGAWWGTRLAWDTAANVIDQQLPV
ncbi:MAG: hypothetical protein IV086_12780 [Hyphomonadaceae bacterium]|nr:hypothetical protein [Hyphomonadaceae bacterium]